MGAHNMGSARGGSLGITTHLLLLIWTLAAFLQRALDEAFLLFQQPGTFFLSFQLFSDLFEHATSFASLRAFLVTVLLFLFLLALLRVSWLRVGSRAGIDSLALLLSGRFWWLLALDFATGVSRVDDRDILPFDASAFTLLLTLIARFNLPSLLAVTLFVEIHESPITRLGADSLVARKSLLLVDQFTLGSNPALLLCAPLGIFFNLPENLALLSSCEFLLVTALVLQLLAVLFLLAALVLLVNTTELLLATETVFVTLVLLQTQFGLTLVVTLVFTV